MKLTCQYCYKVWSSKKVEQRQSIMTWPAKQWKCGYCDCWQGTP